jgi:putative RecB family exonuclease
LKTYDRCPYGYYLARIKKVWQRPAAWLAQGSAVHAAAEQYEKAKFRGGALTLDETQDVFRDSYSSEINAAAEITPDFNRWFASGPYRGAVDIERRYGLGLEQTARFVDWTDSHTEEVIWVSPDGTPGIEIGFDIDLDGLHVRGYIDAVYTLRDEVRVRDYKTGNQPGDDFQLGVYSVAIAEQFDVAPPQQGDYWMGRPGKPTSAYQIGEWTKERVTAEFHRVNDEIVAGRFPAKPDPKVCMFCDVSSSCEYAGT